MQRGAKIVEDSKLEALYEPMKDLSEEQLRQMIIYAEELIADMKKQKKQDYEEEFISVMLNCGLDALNARVNLIDFKAIASAYLQGKGAVYLEDLEYAAEVVLRKNGYTPTYEAKQMVNNFIEKTFGKNIPSMVGSLVI